MAESITSLIEAKVNCKEFRLPVLPSIAMELRDALSNNATVEEVEAIILKDQSMAAETLRLANSALFAGLTRQKTIQQALIRLGSKRVFNFVMLASQQQVFKANMPFLSELSTTLWEHAATCANACRWVAMKCGYNDIAEDAFLAGLLHDLGSMVVIKAVDDIIREKNIEELTKGVITEVIEALHADYGYRVMESWELPAEYAKVARDHHKPSKDLGNPMINIVRLVDAACSKVGIGLTPDPTIVLEALDEPLMLGIKDVHLAELEIELENSIENLAA